MCHYDRGGNILSKGKYAYTTGGLELPVQTINYDYNDSDWKDKITTYNGVPITYDVIGNPLNDGERTYTWGAGRQLRHISMPLTGEAHGFRASNGVHEDSNTVLRIVHDATNSKLKAKLLRDGRDVTTECAASAFVWKKNGSAAGTGKEIAVTTAEINGDVQFSCTYSETQGVYGTVSVNNNLVASHTPATADANHTFSLVNGTLNVEVPNSAGNGTDYALENGVLSVNPGFTGSITAEYEFTTSPTREIDFKYDHNGLRTQKIVVENGVTTTYDYTLHGKLITHLTKRTVDVNGTENTEELHFFYDSQSKPAFVEHNSIMYRYIHNLQGDVVGLLDGNGSLVVEYKYDAWGKPLDDTVYTGIGDLNPFRYRGYVWDAESELYYLRSRYYCAQQARFVSVDVIVSGGLVGLNLFVYCQNNPVASADSMGMEGYYVVLNVYIAAEWNWWNGHYDLSIISKDNPDLGWTFSYGPIIPKGYDKSKFDENDEFDARVDVYASPNRPGKEAKMRFVLFDDFSDEERSAFKMWFESELVLVSESEDKTVRRYQVNNGLYSKYNISKVNYCGSGLVYLVSNMGNRISSSKNTQTALNRLLECALKVDAGVITMFSKLLAKYLPATN